MNTKQDAKGVAHLLRRILQEREALIFLIVLAVSIALTFLSPYFLTKANIQAVLLGLSVEAIMAVGMTILMVSGGFDLSIGSTLGLCGMTCALLLHSIGVVPAILVALLLGIVIGLTNGGMIALIGVNPFVATLATQSIARGLVYIITEGKPAVGLAKEFVKIGQGSFFGVQYPILYMLVIMIAADILLRNFKFFKQNYYIGGNEKSARLSGIKVNKVKIINYVISAGLAAFAGIVLTARVGTASVTAGVGSDMRVVSAVVIGGASLSGGEGSILGAFLGTLLMAIISNALNLMSISVYWQQLVIGLVLGIAVIIDTVGKKKQNAIK